MDGPLHVRERWVTPVKLSNHMSRTWNILREGRYLLRKAEHFFNSKSSLDFQHFDVSRPLDDAVAKALGGEELVHGPSEVRKNIVQKKKRPTIWLRVDGVARHNLRCMHARIVLSHERELASSKSTNRTNMN